MPVISNHALRNSGYGLSTLTCKHNLMVKNYFHRSVRLHNALPNYVRLLKLSACKLIYVNDTKYL